MPQISLKSTAFALSTLLAGASGLQAQSFSYSQETLDFLDERYGNHQGAVIGVDRQPSSDNGFCSGVFGQISRGRIVENEIMNGQGRFSVEIDASDSGTTITFGINIATKGHQLPPPSCGD